MNATEHAEAALALLSPGEKMGPFGTMPSATAGEAAIVHALLALLDRLERRPIEGPVYDGPVTFTDERDRPR